MFYYVYILKSENFPVTFYIGYATNLKQRLSAHNNGQDKHTSKYKPWKIKTASAFTDKQKAISFEKYLKSHSGRAFVKTSLTGFVLLRLDMPRQATNKIFSISMQVKMRSLSASA